VPDLLRKPKSSGMRSHLTALPNRAVTTTSHFQSDQALGSRGNDLAIWPTLWFLE
jgi:hypothetical protein